MTSLTITTDLVRVYILVFVRFAGIIAFNPILARQQIPAQLRAAIPFGAALLLAPTLPVPTELSVEGFEFVLAIFRELAVGLVFGFVVILFYYMLMTAADIMDTQFGLAMAKTMDPGTKVQTAFSGTRLNVIFLAYFFVTNSHLVLIHIAASSYELLPIGAPNLNLEAAPDFAMTLFSSVFSLALRLTFPFVAAELILEMSLGILMKLIPQIHVFVVNMQLKIILAILMLFLLASPICVFIDNYIIKMMNAIQESLYAIVS